jgi:hypothetical protein
MQRRINKLLGDNLVPAGNVDKKVQVIFPKTVIGLVTYFWIPEWYRRYPKAGSHLPLLPSFLPSVY